MGFCKPQTKEMWETLNDESKKRTYEADIAYELSSLFLHLSTGEREQNRERKALKGKSNS